jgi:hypothetical protein
MNRGGMHMEFWWESQKEDTTRWEYKLKWNREIG